MSRVANYLAIATLILLCSLGAANSSDWGYDSPAPAKKDASKAAPASDWGYESSPGGPKPGKSNSSDERAAESTSEQSGNGTIPSSLQPGKRFELSAVTHELHGEEKNYSLPHWLGGSWQCNSETKYPISGPLKNGVKHSRREVQTYGTFDGANGWVYAVKVPRVHQIDEADFVEYRVEIAREFPTINDEQVVTKYQFYAVQVSKADDLIVSTRFQCSTARITPLNKTQIQIAGILTSFDSEGNRERSRSILRLTRMPP